MLVERGAVEARKSVRVGGKVGRGPVQDDAEARRMGAIDEPGETRGLAKSARRREEADRLVAPRFVERMLADRQEFDVRVSHVRRVGNRLIPKLVVAEKRTVGAPPPRAEMDLVDGHGLPAEFPVAAPGHIFGVGPGEVGAVGDDRCGRRPQLGFEAERIGLQRQRAPTEPASSYLSTVPASRSGRRFSRARCRGACASGSGGRPIRLKSPTTEARVAFGAQSANGAPSAPSCWVSCAPRRR